MNASMLGPFALEGRLDAKNEGSVFRAVNVEERRTVAIKIFPAPLIRTSAQARDRFAHEAELLKKLEHPNIVQCIGAGVTDQQGFLACEFIDGETLADLLARRGRLHWETALPYIQQICDALDAALALDITHLDLTPDKILISDGGGLKVSDFRLDRPRNSLCASSHKKLLERATYQAPEMHSADSPSTHRSDLYSLGCIMFEMLSGQPPFEASTAKDIIKQHIRSEAPRISSIVLDAPVWLDALVANLLQKDPAARPHTAGAVTLALSEMQVKIAAGIGVAEHASRGFSPLQMQVSRQEAQQVLAPKKQKPSLADWVREVVNSDKAPIITSVWFLIVVLGLVMLLAVFFARPKSEQQLFEKATELMASEDNGTRRSAREPLRELLRRFPGGEHAEPARQHLDTLEIEVTKARLTFNAGLGRQGKTEVERDYVAVKKLDEDDQWEQALEGYRRLVDTYPAEGNSRPFVLMAQERIADIEKQYIEKERAEIQKRLEKAEQFAKQADFDEAQRLWVELIEQYKDDPRYQDLANASRERMKFYGLGAPAE